MTYTIIFFTVIFLSISIVFWVGLIKETKDEIKKRKVKEVSVIDFITFIKMFKSIDTELKVNERYCKDTMEGDDTEISFELIKANGKFYIPITPVQYGLIQLYCKKEARKIYKNLYKKNKEDKVTVNWFKI